MSRRSSRQPFTEKQGEYLAFIYVYSHMFQRSPAETDMQRYFRVSPPSVHQMVVTLERTGLIRRQPGVPRSIEILVPPEQLPSSNGSKSTRQILCDELLGRGRRSLFEGRVFGAEALKFSFQLWAVASEEPTGLAEPRY